MKVILAIVVLLYSLISSAQKLDINTLEKIAYAPVSSIDTIMKASGFLKSDKQVTKEYLNYYYTSYERKDLFEHLLRSLSFMDVYSKKDTSRLILYRTYYAEDEKELIDQLLANGYELKQQIGTSYIYKKDNFTITNKISEKSIIGGKPKTAYEFELGR